MRYTHTLALVLFTGCVADPSQRLEQVIVTGEVPADVDTEEMTRDFLESGARFGVIVDPASGRSVTLQNLERVSNSSDFIQIGSAVCDDCEPTCSVMTRQVSVELQRTSGSGQVDVTTSSSENWTNQAPLCNGSACPDPSVSVGETLDIDLFGVLATCGTFSIYFDTDDVISTPLPLQNATATFSQGISGNWLASEMIDGVVDPQQGWAIANEFTEQTAVFETTIDSPAYGGGTEVTVEIETNYPTQHLLGCYRLSVTTADRSTFADGLQSGGDIGLPAIWSPLDIFDVDTDVPGQTSTITGNKVVMSNTTDSGALYVVRANTGLTGITGLRLDACEDASLPSSGPGTSSVNGNFVVNELRFATRAR